jgi:hypothetical protein
MKIVLHEAQHAIQEAEDFQKGAAPKNFVIPPHEVPMVENVLGDIETAVGIRLFAEDKAQKDYGKRLTELEASVQMDLMRQVVHEQRMAKNPELDITLDAEMAARYKTSEQLFDEHAELSDALARSDYEGHKGYAGNVGEIESREVERRMGYTPEKRREEYPRPVPFHVPGQFLNYRPDTNSGWSWRDYKTIE